jgi:hypothetical protein
MSLALSFIIFFYVMGLFIYAVISLAMYAEAKMDVKMEEDRISDGRDRLYGEGHTLNELAKAKANKRKAARNFIHSPLWPAAAFIKLAELVSDAREGDDDKA